MSELREEDYLTSKTLQGIIEEIYNKGYLDSDRNKRVSTGRLYERFRLWAKQIKEVS